MMYKISPFTYSFNQRGKVRKIFSQISIELPAKGLILISGPSGGGKSTFLKILKGIIPEYESGKLQGEIQFFDEPMTGEYFKKHLKDILYLFQNPFSQLIYPDVEEEFFFSMENFNFTREQMNRKQIELSKKFGLESIWGKKTNQLSSGECQRLVLASLLAIGPKVLLLDEPTAFLDTKARENFYEFLNEIKKSYLVIIIDHHKKEIQDIIDREIYVSKEGEIGAFPLASMEKNEPSYDHIFNQLEAIKPARIKLENIYFRYQKESLLLEGITAQFQGGEIISIKGANGVGKSTLFKLIAGMLKPTSGKIELSIAEEIISNKNFFKYIGYIFQNPETHFFYDTIEEELAQSLKKITVSHSKEYILNNFFNEIDLKKSPFLLSEGEKRRLSILMTVFLQKNIILYDEPTFGQDQESIDQVFYLMKSLQHQKFLQILISHDDDFIQRVSNRILTLENGTLIEL